MWPPLPRRIPGSRSRDLSQPEDEEGLGNRGRLLTVANSFLSWFCWSEITVVYNIELVWERVSQVDRPQPSRCVIQVYYHAKKQ